MKATLSSSSQLAYRNTILVHLMESCGCAAPALARNTKRKPNPWPYIPSRSARLDNAASPLTPGHLSSYELFTPYKITRVSWLFHYSTDSHYKFITISFCKLLM